MQRNPERRPDRPVDLPVVSTAMAVRRRSRIGVAGSAARRAGRLALATLALLGATGVPGAAVGGAYAAAPAPVPVRILPLGDSLTYGIGSSTLSGYRTELGRRLTAAGVDVDFVGSQSNGHGPDLDHEGHPGWQIEQLSEHIDDWMAESRPDVVLLDIGTNDYVHADDPTIAPARLADLLDRILLSSPTVRVVVAKLLVPIGVGRAAGIRTFNATIPAIVARKGPRVSVADMSRISNRNTREGLHPDDLGYRQMAYQWFKALHPLLGGSWPASADPFPLPRVRLGRSSAVVPHGVAVTFTVRLSGALTAADLGGVPVQLVYRRLGTDRSIVLRTGRTTADGRVTFRQSLTQAGEFTARVVGGRAAGRRSAGVRVAAS